MAHPAISDLRHRRDGGTVLRAKLPIGPIGGAASAAAGHHPSSAAFGENNFHESPGKPENVKMIQKICINPEIVSKGCFHSRGAPVLAGQPLLLLQPTAACACLSMHHVWFQIQRNSDYAVSHMPNPRCKKRRRPKPRVSNTLAFQHF
jgi:hypothetical protein